MHLLAIYMSLDSTDSSQFNQCAFLTSLILLQSLLVASLCWV